MREIIFHDQTNTFHLYNEHISYIMTVLENGHLGSVYFGRRIRDRENFFHFLEKQPRPMSQYVFDNDRSFSLEHIRQEYPVYGTTDYRSPAVEIMQKNGSTITDFRYVGHEITEGKPSLTGLPATYCENDSEAITLRIFLKDDLTNMRLSLLYTVFDRYAAIARSACLENGGEEEVFVTCAMSLSMDLPDKNYTWVQLSGAWGRERHVCERRLDYGLTAVQSMRGNSSHEHNPFIILKRPETTENAGEAVGVSLIYSGNFRIQAETDTHEVVRLSAGIHPERFCWKLEKGEGFQTPEAMIVYTDKGLNDMSQTFHSLYGRRLARGYWRDRPRPVLINNWEATYFAFDEEKLLKIAGKAKECGVELFVLDDGWFGSRRNDRAGLGDWVANTELLPDGIGGLSEKIEALGLKFGLWFEPEMVNKDSDLYRAHPEWILSTPGRNASHGRYQYVLDFSRKEVVDHIYESMHKILSGAKISYVKWDMNRSITECYGKTYPPDRQGEIFHRYILGVYNLYERLICAFPHILFESCASGGARFDPGMLYYAPQCWTSDDTDAVERLKIQYGTSMCYPLSSMGSHVSVVPNHQVFRITPLKTRANVAFFGTFGYELDLNRLTCEEIGEVREQIGFMKEYRELLQFGTFYRLNSPFTGNVTAWMVVSDDRKTAIIGWYRVLNEVNRAYTRIYLRGLREDVLYENRLTGKTYYGDELMYAGMSTTDSTAGEVTQGYEPCTDFESRLYILTAFPGEKNGNKD